MADLYYNKEENTNLVSRLYALRAGLSVATQEAECAKQAQRESENLITQRNEELANYEKLIKDVTREIEMGEYVKTHEYEPEFYKKNQYERQKKYIHKVRSKHIFLIIFYAICVLLLLTYNNALDNLLFKGYHVFYYVCIIGCPIFIIGIVVRIVRMVRDNKIILAPSINLIKSYEKDLENIKNSRFNRIKELPKHKKELKRLESEKQDAINSINQKYNPKINERQSQYDLHIRTGRIYCDNLDNQFKSLIDRRDWKFVDYIIFCLETGRAETLKECLKLADEEDRTQRLENTIQQASNSIQVTLNQKFAQLQGVISSEMASLRRTIDSGFAGQAMSMQKISGQMNGVSDRLSQISSAQYTNNALMKNIAYNSYLMANECNRFAQDPLYL